MQIYWSFEGNGRLRSKEENKLQLMEFLYKLVESIFSKLGEKLVHRGLDETHEDTFISLRNNMRELSAKAFDVDEEIRKAEQLGNKKRKREVKEWIESVQIMENKFRAVENTIKTEGFISRFFRGGYAAKLNGRICRLAEQSQHFGELLVVCEIKGKTLLTSSLVGREVERNLKRILKFLLENNGVCIGICGMGGSGKTTLAKHVNNKLLEHFGYRVSWITVSQQSGIMSLQDKIGMEIGLDLSNEDDKDKRASMLHGVLSKKKNRLLIFDDMWEVIDLKKVGIPLSVDGCKLMLTTRSREVCHQMQCKQVIEVKILSKEEGWNLFNEILGQETKLTPSVQEIAKSMVELCDGLPLGIVTLAGSMRGETSRNVWINALEELKESLMEGEDMREKVFKVLESSFDQLGQGDGKHSHYSTFQLCFLHCSLYPKDYLINRNELITQFLSHEFLEKRKSRKAMIVQGHAVLDKLVNAFLLERSNARVKMHGLVRAMALKIMEGNTKVISGHNSLKEIPSEEEWTKDLEKVSLMKNGITKIPSSTSPNCSKLSTLLLRENPLVCIPNSFLLKMNALCILDLSRTDIRELPESFSDMENLKAVILQECWQLVYIPNMVKLKRLRELDISGTAIVEVPQGMEVLVNLTSLSLQGARNLKMLSRGFLLNFPYIQCLHLPCHIQAPTEEIEKLNHLEEFCGRVRDGTEFNSLVRSKPNWLYSIVVGSDSSLYDFAVSGGPREYMLSKYRLEKDKEKGLISLTQGNQCLQLNPSVGRSNCVAENIAALNNERSNPTTCEGINCIRMRAHTVFLSLTQLGIYDCKKIKKLGLIALQLVNLEVFWIERCEALEELLEQDNGETGVVSLPKLQCLHLQQLPRLKSICNMTIACSSIKTISLKKCPRLKKLPLVFGKPNHQGSTRSSPEFTISLLLAEKEWWERMELGHPTYSHRLQPFVKYDSKDRWGKKTLPLYEY